MSGAAGESLARRFHETYERLAPSFGYETRKASAVPWEQVPEDNRRLMVAVCAELLSVVADTTAGEAESLVGVLVRSGVWPLAVAERAAAALAARSGGAQDDGLRDALRIHHPIMRSETGPFSGCRCGQVGLGQDVIAHVVTELRRALAGPRRDEERLT